MFKKIIWFLVVLVIACIYLVKSNSSKSTVDDLEKSIVCIEKNDNKECISNGFFINNQGMILLPSEKLDFSNNNKFTLHYLHKSPTPQAHPIDEKEIFFDKTVGLALIKINLDGNPSLLFTENKIKQGDNIYSFGFKSRGLDSIKDDGEIISIFNEKIIDKFSTKNLKTDTFVNIGSPILNNSGSVVGMNSRYDTNQHHIGLHQQEIIKFLDNNKTISYEYAKVDNPMMEYLLYVALVLLLITIYYLYSHEKEEKKKIEEKKIEEKKKNEEKKDNRGTIRDEVKKDNRGTIPSIQTIQIAFSNPNKTFILKSGESKIIGRAGDFVIEDESRRVSREHLEISYEYPNIYIIDKSTDGTFKNGMEIKKGEKILIEKGDKIRLGKYENQFEFSV